MIAFMEAPKSLGKRGKSSGMPPYCLRHRAVRGLTQLVPTRPLSSIVGTYGSFHTTTKSWTAYPLVPHVSPWSSERAKERIRAGSISA
jgi:hypothetical protein